MTASDRRIDNLFGGLTARERAVVAIKAWKEDRHEPLALRRSVPPEQEVEFYDLLSYFRALGIMVASLAAIWGTALDKHTARHAWLQTLELTEIYMSSLASYIAFHTREMITESDHARRIEEQRSQMLPLADLAEWLAEENQEWGEADREDGYVSDRAIARVTKEKKPVLQKLFEDGTISGRRKGRGVELNLGSFYDWWGQPIPLCPEWGLNYEIVADDREEEVRRENAERDHARSIVRHAFSTRAGREEVQEPLGGALHAAVEKQLIAGVVADSRYIYAADQLVGDFQRRLGGEDPLDAEVREILDHCRTELATLREQLGVEADEAIEDCAEVIKSMREFIENAR